MNAWISIGKRKALFSLDVEGTKSCAHSEQFNHHQMTLTEKNNSHFRKRNFSKKWIPEKLTTSLQKGPSQNLVTKPESFDAKGVLLPYVHSRMRAVKEIISEICHIDKINVAKYRRLDDRQRSLLNKILTYKYQTEFLDVIDTGGITTVNTEEYLRDDHKLGHEKTIMYLRLRKLLDTKSIKLQPDHCLNGFTDLFNHLAVGYFGELGQTGTSAPRENTSALFQEVTTIRQLAAVAINNHEPTKWLAGMKDFLQDLIHVSQDKIISEYENTIDARLTNFFHDEDHDVNSFFARLKVKMKEGKVTLPLTNYEIKHWDNFVVHLLKCEIGQLDSYLLNTSTPSDSGLYHVNHNDQYTDPQKSCLEDGLNEASNLADPLRYHDGQG